MDESTIHGKLEFFTRISGSDRFDPCLYGRVFQASGIGNLTVERGSATISLWCSFPGARPRETHCTKPSCDGQGR